MGLQVEHETAVCPGNQDQQPIMLYGMSTGQEMVGNCIIHHSFFFSFTLLFLLFICVRIFLLQLLNCSYPINFTVFQILPILREVGSE